MYAFERIRYFERRIRVWDNERTSNQRFGIKSVLLSKQRQQQPDIRIFIAHAHKFSSIALSFALRAVNCVDNVSWTMVHWKSLDATANFSHSTIQTVNVGYFMAFAHIFYNGNFGWLFIGNIYTRTNEYNTIWSLFLMYRCALFKVNCNLFSLKILNSLQSLFIIRQTEMRR